MEAFAADIEPEEGWPVGKGEEVRFVEEAVGVDFVSEFAGEGEDMALLIGIHY